MLTDYMELYRWQRPSPTADSAGGHHRGYEEKGHIRAALAAAEGREVVTGGLLSDQCTTALLHEKTLLLKQNDRLIRLRDGACYRVLTPSEDMETPRRARLQLCQVRVERLVTA